MNNVKQFDSCCEFDIDFMKVMEKGEYDVNYKISSYFILLGK